MPSKHAIAYVTIRVFSHATEDPQKVTKAIENTLPENLATTLTFTKSELSGHHGNPITIYEAKLTDRLALPQVLEKITTSLNSLDKETLCEEMHEHIEKRNLYLRLDKQSALLGTLKISTDDPIHFKIHFRNKTPEEITTICTEAGLRP